MEKNLKLPAEPSQPALQANRNGWTEERKASFIETLGKTTSVTAAAAAVGMTPQSAYWLKRNPKAGSFSDDWDAAVAKAWQQVESSVFDRVLNGETETFYREGIQYVRHRPCSANLAIHMLGRAIIAREKAEAKAREISQITIAEIEEVRAEIRRVATENRPKSENV